MAVNDFSEYLRGNLDSLKQLRPVPFGTELRHVKTYLSLEKMCYEEELQVRYDIQATLFELPALSVQPLVENAVKYGMGKKTGGG
ncbi:histidine kinase, partial [Eubacterium aggregans]|uniref:histidine kinase n=1 Tax=Eubacterium aggregans TaxID=81409 RepID=UPI003F3D21A5